MNRILSFCLLGLLLSCQPATSSTENADDATTEDDHQSEASNHSTEAPSVDPTDTKLLITRNSFMGIQPGDNIIDHQAYLKKDLLQTGEGDFEIFLIHVPKGNPLGYLHPDPNDEERVGMIVDTSPQAKTEDGLSVGMTLGDLRLER